MFATVTTRRIRIRIEGEIPSRLLALLKKLYPRELRLSETDPSKDSVNAFETDWYKKVSKSLTPATALRTLRENRGLSQTELAEKLGPSVRKTHVSDWELGRRGISKAIAKKLSQVLGTSVEHFI